MKALFKCGLCLVLGVWSSRATADELQWRNASSGQAAAPAVVPPITDAPGSSAPSVRLMPAVPVTLMPGIPLDQSNGFDSFKTRPATIRAQSADDARPLPQRGSFATPISPAVGDDPAPMQPFQTPVPNEQIPVNPTPLPQNGAAIFEGSNIFGSCDCGLAGPSVIDGSCGCGTAVEGCTTCAPCESCSTCFPDCGCCYNSNRNHLWVNGEFLLWAFSSPHTTGLVVTGTPNDGFTAPAVDNAHAVDGTNFSSQMHAGARFELGFWFPGCDDWGLQLGALFLAPRTTTFQASSGVLGRPFTDVTPGDTVPTGSTQSVEPVNGTFQGITTTGSIRVDNVSELWGVEADLRHKLCCFPGCRWDLLLGFRNLNLRESVSINENLAFLGTNEQITDRFATNNSFYGGQIGIDGEVRLWQRWFIGGTIKVAVGDVYQTVNIGGNSVTTVPGVGQFITNSGVFANYPTNAGNYSRNQFAVAPEATLKFGVDITDRLRLFVGYDILYLSNAVRPGDVIDRQINTNFQVPNNGFGAFTPPPPGSGPARPAFVFRNTDFWAQGVTAGIEWHY